MNKDLKNISSVKSEISPADGKPKLAEGLWCIKVQANNDCWIADWDGDPGRTLVKENAKTFSSKSDAEKMCGKMKSKYPNRNLWVDVF